MSLRDYKAESEPREEDRLALTPAIRRLNADIRFVVYKQDVAMSLANALMFLGKNDIERVRYHIENAGRNFEMWLIDRPEKFWHDRARMAENQPHEEKPTAQTQETAPAG